LIFEEVNNSSGLTSQPAFATMTVQSRMCREAYLEAIIALKDHIHRGDCYEINYCQEFFVEQTDISPLAVYTQLIDISPNPFSALYRLNDLYCICASPERYIKKTGQRVISQPIKGTASRNHLNPGEDFQNKLLLRNSAKEQSENVMVVDLVRNDLSKICRQGTVHVDELFGIYSFPQVHQMISTISGIVEPGKNWVDIVKATFPMGSMTGAPKKKVMQLIEAYELTRRGMFSGSIGYITPEGDADFNVVIRSILYNASTRYLSFQAGSAITSSSDPLKEYEECLIKIKAIKKALGC
jgi:para-aminobenzoate synthetase component I